MPSRTLFQTLIALLLGAFLSAAVPALAQSLRVPERGELGLDPAFARGWLAPDFDRFGFARYQWRDPIGLTPSERMNLSYNFGERGSLGMSMGAVRELEYERQLSLFGRYWFAPEWAFSAQMLTRESSGLLRPNDFRVGVQRSF